MYIEFCCCILVND